MRIGRLIVLDGMAVVMGWILQYERCAQGSREYRDESSMNLLYYVAERVS